MIETEGNPGFSVLMSVYAKEKAEFLRESMESVWGQTVPSDDFVLVCDGPLGDELNQVIRQMQERFGSVLRVVRLEKNVGLGNALNEGLRHCKHELVARMDSDDVCFADRFERQLQVFGKHPEFSIVCGTVAEFTESPQAPTGKRELPVTHEAICAFSKKRNPFNHPAVMFRKTSVEEAGCYSEVYPLFEDYYLWVRMLRNGSVGYNLKEPVLWMRTPSDLYVRRGGKKYAGDMLRFHRWLREVKWSGKMDYWCGAVPHALVCVMPNGMRKIVYKLLRK